MPLLELLGRWLKPQCRIRHGRDGARLDIFRERAKSGSLQTLNRLHVGPNRVHACIFRADGTYEDLGVSTNLLTTVGRDWWARSWGYIPAGGQNTPATAATATSLTGTGTVWTATNLAGSPAVLGLAGMRVIVPVAGVTTAPVYGNICSNTSSAITVDQWWNASDTTGATPASTNSFLIVPGGLSSLRFVALSADATSPAAADTTLASEITTNSLGRALATFAHTEDQAHASLTLTKTWTASGTTSNIQKAGMFTCLPSSPAGPLIYEATISPSATLGSGDSLQLTWQITLSG